MRNIRNFKFVRTKYCGEFNSEDIDKNVVVVGWVNSKRNLGNLIFIDLRDRTGVVQLTFDGSINEKMLNIANLCKNEFVIAARGVVKERSNKNSTLKTGDIEIFIYELYILAKSDMIPFEINDKQQQTIHLDLRMKYRYLDLRRSEMQDNLIFRSKIVKMVRDYFCENGFIEIETPVLVKSTPEGARDYLVPSRSHKGKFYALPQSPQLYKQLLMFSGFDRYFQIVRCFRDEDLRADRQPEFTQIDLEMSFVDVKDVICINEKLVRKIFESALNIKIQDPFDIISYNDAIMQYGTDKPDTRFSMKLIDITEGFKNTQFQIFSLAMKSGKICALNFKDGSEKINRKQLNKLTDLVKQYGAKGLFYIKILNDQNISNFEKFLTQSEVDFIISKTDANFGDLIFIVADSNSDVVYSSLGFLRKYLGDKFKLYGRNSFSFLWVTNFPLLEYSESEGRYIAKHHPFTSVIDDDIDKLDICPEKCIAKAYDLVINGCEVGGGSIRINDPILQSKMLKILGFSEDKANSRFGFLLEALKYGAPPHGGMAYGLDRLIMLMLNKSSIRDVIAFPKVQSAAELMTNCPDMVDDEQLSCLNISVK